MPEIMMQDIETMAIPAPEQILRNTGAWALFIDIDGTLLEMAPTPDAVVVPPEVVRILAALEETFGGAVALSTGRRVSDADQLLAPLQLTTCGVHGTEARVVPGGKTITLVQPVPQALLDAVIEVALMAPGALVEPKGVGIAVHYRNVPDARPLLVQELARVLAELRPFRAASWPQGAGDHSPGLFKGHRADVAHAACPVPGPAADHDRR